MSALATCVGFDSFFVLRDVRGLSKAESGKITRWMADAMLRKCVADAKAVSLDDSDASDVGVA